MKRIFNPVFISCENMYHTHSWNIENRYGECLPDNIYNYLILAEFELRVRLETLSEICYEKIKQA